MLISRSGHESGECTGLHRCILTFFLALSNVIKPEAGTISLEKALSGNSVASSNSLPLREQREIKNGINNDRSLNVAEVEESCLAYRFRRDIPRVPLINFDAGKVKNSLLGRYTARNGHYVSL